jgi:uncharacterized protein
MRERSGRRGDSSGSDNEGLCEWPRGLLRAMNKQARPLALSMRPGRFAICRLNAREGMPAWVLGCTFWALVRASETLSMLVPQEVVPEAAEVEGGWRLLELEGPFAFSAVGILAAVLAPLAGAGIPILAFSGFDTDYVLVKDDCLAEAIAALHDAGHNVLGAADGADTVGRCDAWTDASIQEEE